MQTKRAINSFGVSTLALWVAAGMSMAWAADWPKYGGNDANWSYSELKQINTDNVSRLEFAWAWSLGTPSEQETRPLVINGVMYATSSGGPKYVYALNARTGEKIWHVEFEMPKGVQQYACCGLVNRGPAYADGVLYVGRLDGKLTALDAETGKELWTVEVVDYTQGSVITSPPIIVKDKVVIGFGGGEYGARGYISAFDRKTGERKWKTWTVPGPGEPGNETWKEGSWEHGGGTAWLIASYDPELNLIYYGTSNPAPWNAAVRGPNTSDYGQYTNQWTAATIALNADTGEIVWGFQGTPHDAWDYDGVNELILADLDVDGDGKLDKVGLKADRNGYLFVLDRVTGKPLSVKPFVEVNWSTGWDFQANRPIEVPAKRPRIGYRATDICPNLIGGKNWQPMAFSPDTGLVYIPANNLCMDMEDSEVEYRRGMFYLGKEFPTKPGPGGYLGALIAWDPIKGEPVWMIKEKYPFNGGVLATAGGLVFSGNYEGLFRAIDARTGKVLWEKRLGSGIHAGPVTYEVDGKQYVAIAVGRSQTIPGFLGDIGRQMLEAMPQGGMLFAFTLRD